jgi:hypothetical protein
MLFAEAAILLALQTVGGILLFFGGVVVTLLTVGAGKHDFDAHGMGSPFLSISAAGTACISLNSLRPAGLGRCSRYTQKTTPAGEVQLLYHTEKLFVKVFLQKSSNGICEPQPATAEAPSEGGLQTVGVGGILL